ncbi:uncharacterized protein LOC135216887 [Macrobrachium nipponense]|uniref:uncharacterized protein LOC135216887 n=1 Tax=Macrobrachium nipponense TaxID=159736 RepID=UPI0030C7D578
MSSLLDFKSNIQVKTSVISPKCHRDSIVWSTLPPITSLSIAFLLLSLNFGPLLARTRATHEPRLISRIFHRHPCLTHPESTTYNPTYSHDLESDLIFEFFVECHGNSLGNITNINKYQKFCLCYLLSHQKTRRIRIRHSSFSKKLSRKNNPKKIIHIHSSNRKAFIKLLQRHGFSPASKKCNKKLLTMFAKYLEVFCCSANPSEGHLTKMVPVNNNLACKHCRKINSPVRDPSQRRVQKRNLENSGEMNSTHDQTFGIQWEKRPSESNKKSPVRPGYTRRTQSKYHTKRINSNLEKEIQSSGTSTNGTFISNFTKANAMSTAPIGDKCTFMKDATLCLPRQQFDIWKLSAASEKVNIPAEVLTAPQESLASNISDTYNSSFYIPLSTSSSSPCFLYAVNSSHVGTYGCNTDLLSNFTTSESTPSSLTATEWTRIVAFSLIFVVGVVGNVLVVVTLLHHRNLRTVTNVFLLNLAVSDLLLGVFCMPFTLVGSLLQDFVFGSLMCRLIPYMQAVSVSVSVWTLVAISLERFYAICQPLRSRRWQTPSHSYRVIAVVWAASLVFMMPIAVLSTLMPVRRDPVRHKCREVWPSLTTERTFNIIITMTLLLVPLIVMAAAYIRVVRALWLGVKIQRSKNSPNETPHLEVSTVEDLTSNHARPPDKKSSPATHTRISIRFRKVPAVKGAKDETNDPRKDFNDHHSDDSPRSSTHEGGQLTSSIHHDSSRDEESRSLRRKWWRSRDHSSSTATSVDRQSWRNLRSSHTERSIMAKRRVVRMLFVLVAEFFICWTPLFIVNLLSLYIPRQVYAALGSIGVSLVQLLAYISSCCNPITYCFMNAKFLQSFKQTFGCAHKRSNSFYSNNAHSFRSGVNYNQVPLHTMLDRNSRTGRSSQRQRLMHQPNQTVA